MVKEPYIFDIGAAEVEVVQQAVLVARVNAEHATPDVILHVHKQPHQHLLRLAKITYLVH